uniref:CDA1-En n=1 Tax=Arundo donax TaxID=35708 RepID=A0A0A9DK99_ARUDO
MLWQLTTTSSLRTTTAPKGPPSPHSTPRYASSTAFVKNLWSLSCTAVKFAKTRLRNYCNSENCDHRNHWSDMQCLNFCQQVRLCKYK